MPKHSKGGDMGFLRKALSYLSVAFALYFGVMATLCLIQGQLGVGLMYLVFALYFVFDFKTDRLNQRLLTLEKIEAMRMQATMEIVKKAYENQEPPTGMSQ